MAIVYNIATGNAASALSSTGTINHAAKVAVVITIGYLGTTSPNAVTVGGVAAALITGSKVSNGTSNSVEARIIWRDAAANDTVSVGFAVSTRHAWSAVAYTGASILYENVLTNTGSGASPTTSTVTPGAGTTGRMLICGVCVAQSAAASGSITIVPGGTPVETQRDSTRSLAGSGSVIAISEEFQEISDNSGTHADKTTDTKSSATLNWATVGFGLKPPTLAYRDISTRFKMTSAMVYRDIATRFKMTVNGFRDISTRFRMQVTRDINTRFKMTVKAYRDINTRFKMTVQGYRDISTRFFLRGQSFRDISTRFKLQEARDISTRFLLKVTRDINTRFRMTVRGFRDIRTRFKLQETRDIATRFRLQVTRDISTRFKMTVKAYRDIATRFRLQVTRDVLTRFKLQVTRDIATRFILQVTRDINSRFVLQVTRDISTRFYLIIPFYRDIYTRFFLAGGGTRDIGTRFLLVSGAPQYDLFGGEGGMFGGGMTMGASTDTTSMSV